MILKFNAQKVDEIEKIKKKPIEECIGDTSISNIALFIEKGAETDSAVVTKNMAMDLIDEYLKEDDKDGLVLFIMEALVDAGFLSRVLDIKAVRESKSKEMKQIMKELKK